MRERRVESGEVELAVREWGEAGDRPTVILLHGYPDTGAVWTGVAERLAGRFHVVAYDVRGAGGSTAPRAGWAAAMDGARPAVPDGYAMPRLLGDLAAVVDAVCRPGERVHLVGHDWGALQGWAAVIAPGTRDRIASFTSTGGVSLSHLSACLRRLRERGASGRLAVMGQMIRSSYIGFFQAPVLPELAVRAVGRRGWERTLRRQGVPPRPWHPAGTLERDALTGLNLYRANMPAGRPARGAAARVGDDPGAVGAGGAGGDPPRVTVPVQIVVATRDRYLSPEVARAHAEWADQAWVRQAAAGHWINVTHPDLMSRWITEFVDAVHAVTPLRSYEGGAFDSQLVVVTGAGSGIGRATAYGFAANGARVVAADVDEAAAKRTADGIAARGGAAHACQVDVADAGAMAGFAAWVRENHGVPDIVVNNAGIALVGSLLDTPEDDWARIRSINLDGVYRGCRLFGRQMVERGQGGHLVNVSSMAAFAPSAALPAYAAVKAAVLQLSECLRLELAEHGIGVSAICPGVINTPITQHAGYLGITADAADRMRRRARRMFARRAFPPEKVALAIMRAVLRDRPVVPVTPEAYVGRALSRISPAATRALSVLSRRLDPSLRRAASPARDAGWVSDLPAGRSARQE
jgi:NAD(P)-dependent dehydrogenase (short-subunit alcohol dehydrogenase family)/pimeloyl-ACP methyl ester carboxylesterase